MSESREVLVMPATASERREMELLVLGVQCGIAVAYFVLVYGGFFGIDGIRRDLSVAWIAAMHVPQVWYTVAYRARGKTLSLMEAATPLMDISSITAAWLAVGDPDSYIWTAYLYGLVGYSRRLRGRPYLLSAAFIIANVIGGALFLNVSNGRSAFDVNIAVVGIVSTAIAAVSHAIGAAWQRAEARSRLLAETDPLTGIANRRTFMERLDTLGGDGEPFAFLMVDLDNFKLLNDREGHLEGDAVLAAVAATLATSIRPGDRLARFGGEEFVVALPGAGTYIASDVAERLRLAIRAGGRTTVSVGCAASRPGEAPGAVLRRADDLLLAAKGGGKDRVRVDEPLRLTA